MDKITRMSYKLTCEKNQGTRALLQVFPNHDIPVVECKTAVIIHVLHVHVTSFSIVFQDLSNIHLRVGPSS